MNIFVVCTENEETRKMQTKFMGFNWLKLLTTIFWSSEL